MSDINSGLPVRTQLPGQVAYDDVIVKIGDGTTPSQLLAVDSAGLIGSKLFDGAGTAITSQANGAQQALDVGINVAGVQIDPRQIRALTAADVVTANQGSAGTAAGGWFVKITDGTDTVAVNADGSLNITDNGGSITVDGTVSASNFPATVDTNYGTVGANTIRTASQIGNATGAADFNFGAGGAQTLRVAALIGNATGAANFNAGATGAQTLRVEANQGAPNTNANGWFVRVTDGTNNQTVTAGGAAVVQASNLPTTVDTNYGAVGASTIRTAAQIGNATGAADFGNGATGAQTLRVAANLALAGTDVSATNPIPVYLSSDNVGTEVNNYNTASAIAAGASSNHDYTVTAGKTLFLRQVESSASGRIKMEIQVETGVATGVFLTRFVQFGSTSVGNMSIHLESPISVAAGVRVRVIRTNRDLLPQDVYSTICGQEVP